MSEQVVITKEEPVNPAAETPKAQDTAPDIRVVSSGPSAPESEPAAAASDPMPEEFDFFEEEEKPSKPLPHFKKEHSDFSRDEWILSRIGDEHLMEYLTLEQKRTELLQKAKDIREKRLLTAFELAASLAAVVAITFFLRHEPSILINILYILGIVAALWLWKNPKK